MSKQARWLSALLVSVLVCFLSSGCTKEVRKTRHQEKGDRAFAAQHYDEAEIEYLKVLQIAPLDPVALRQLGTIYQEQGRWPRAYAFLKKAVELSPEDQQVHLQLSLAYFSLQNRKMAAQEASWILNKQPGQEEAVAVLADCATSLKEVQDTQSQFEKLRNADKDRAAYHVAQGSLWLKQLNLTNAETEIKKALDLDTQSASANMALGNLYWITNNLSAADNAFKSAAELSPIRSARRLKYAEFKLSTRAVEAAKKILQEMTDKAPDYLPAWNLLAQVALGERHFDECNNFLQRVMARDPLNYDGLLLMGNLKLVKGDTAQAVAEFEHMASLYDRSPQVQFQLARAYLLNGDTSKAITKLNRAIASDPNFADAILLLASINLRKGETGAAVASLKEFVKRQPQLPQPYLLLANAYLAQQEPDQAVSICQQMETRFPKSPEVSLVLGSVYAKENHPDQARQAFERALELSSNYLPALEQIVDLDVADKKYAAAIDRVTHQIDRQAGAAEPWLLLAKVHIAKAQSYLDTGNSQVQSKTKPELGDVPAAQPDVTQAENALLKSIQLNPGLRNSYFMLASLYVSCNRQKQALDRLKDFLSKTNDVVAWMQVGIIHDKLKEYSAARDAYAKVLAINPNFSLALNNLAYLYSEHFGDLGKAYELAEKARQFLPDDPSTADTLGWILFKRGEYERALGIIEEGAAKLPNDPEIQFHVGMAHYMLVEEEPARLALQQATQDSKDFGGKDEARRRLKVLSIDVNTANPSAVSDLKGYLRDSPADPVALCRLGAIQQREGAVDNAAQSYEAALKCSPQNPKILLKLAQLYSSGHSPDSNKALELAKQAHSLEPDDPRISGVLGRLVLAAGDSKWSASLLEDSARQLPGDPEISYDLAWAYYSLGRISDSLTAMGRAQNATATDQREEAKRFVKLVSTARDGTTGEALSAEADKALRADPAYVPALAISALIQERQGNFQQAATLYDRILAVYPLFAPATRALAILCSQHLGDDSRAYSLAVTAREAFPQDPEIAKVLGILEYRKANYRRAVQLLRESAPSRKDDAELFYFLGMVQYQLKARPESKAALEQALALNVQPKFADDAKRVLLELK